MIEFCETTTPEDLRQIIELQSENLAASLTSDELRSQGFVTVQHSFEILETMNQEHHHAIARDGDRVIGYALVMLRTFGSKIPILVPMFDKISALIEKGLIPANYVVMGQICISKPYRGKSVFAGLYNRLRTQLSTHFECIVTEIASRNTRSMAAHAKVGFQTVHIYDSDLGERWNIVMWNWKGI